MAEHGEVELAEHVLVGDGLRAELESLADYRLIQACAALPFSRLGGLPERRDAAGRLLTIPTPPEGGD